MRLESPLDCAGSFKSEGLGVALFEQISSQDPTALIGLPLIFVADALRKLGADPLRPSTFLASSAVSTAFRSSGSGALALNGSPVSGQSNDSECACRNIRVRPNDFR